MDKNKYTPEEEAYLRMLDQEVPDLWGRIEAGLDRTAYQNPPMMEANAAVDMNVQPSREERFYAAQQDNVVPFESKRKNKSHRTALIIGVAAAAVVLLGSLAIIGLTGRESKKDSATDESVSYDINMLNGGSAKSESEEKEKGRGSQKSQQSYAPAMKDDIMAEEEGAMDGEIDSPTLSPENGAAMEEAAESAKQGAKRDTEAEATADVPPQEGEAGTLRQLAKQDAISSTPNPVFLTVDGEDMPYYITGTRIDDGKEMVMLLDQKSYYELTDEKKREEKAIVLPADTEVLMKEINGVLSPYIPQQ